MSMMKFNIMSREHGHSVEAFDKNDATAMAKARALFDEIHRKGDQIAEKQPEGTEPNLKIVQEFNPNATEYVNIRPIQGG